MSSNKKRKVTKPIKRGDTSPLLFPVSLRISLVDFVVGEFCQVQDVVNIITDYEYYLYDHDVLDTPVIYIFLHYTRCHGKQDIISCKIYRNSLFICLDEMKVWIHFNSHDFTSETYEKYKFTYWNSYTWVCEKDFEKYPKMEIALTLKLLQFEMCYDYFTCSNTHLSRSHLIVHNMVPHGFR